MLKSVIVAQISDMHIKRRGHILHHMPHVAQPLHRVLAAIDRLRPAPDCIIATGDLTEAGTFAEYARLREILNDHAFNLPLRTARLPRYNEYSGNRECARFGRRLTPAGRSTPAMGLMPG
jgi:3',5'-cyclic AMP phosphodiesterase CpdA